MVLVYFKNGFNGLATTWQVQTRVRKEGFELNVNGILVYVNSTELTTFILWVDWKVQNQKSLSA